MHDIGAKAQTNPFVGLYTISAEVKMKPPPTQVAAKYLSKVKAVRDLCMWFCLDDFDM